ncbi:MAG: hypothetical protein HUJ95_02865, partial [Bacteroidales bacterium]|nr:hypothetical protein [Bacteroidales bacterium]
MKTKRFLFLVAFLTSSLLTLSAQNDKPALDHSVYDSWKGFADLQIPYDGNILYYTVREEQGDSFLTYRDLRTDKEIKIERGTHITVDKEGKFALVRISPAYKLTRQEKIDKTPAAKKLQDSLAIVNFSTGVVTKLPNAKSPKYGDNLGRYFAYKMIKDPEEIKEAEEKAAKEAEAKAAQEAEAASGTAAKAAEGTATEATVAEALASKDTTAKAEAKKPAKKKSTKWKRQLVIYDLTKMAQCDTLDNVEAAYFDNKSTRLVCTFSSDAKDKKDTLRAICFYSLKTGKVDTVFTQNKKAYLNGPDLDESGRYLTFLASSDTSKKKSDRPNLYIWSKEGCRILLAADDSRIPEGMGIRTKSTISFSSDSTKFYFALHPIEPEKDTTNALPAFERAKVAVWSWNEPILHTAQSTLMTFAEKSQKYLSRIALDGSGDIVTFEDDTLRSVSIKKDYKTDYVLATTTIPYRLQQQWDRETVYDIYRVNLTDGSREKIREAVKYGGLLPSPDGKWYCWYALEESQWYIYNIETGAT